MASEKLLLLVSVVVTVLLGTRGSEGSYQLVPSQENVFTHGVKIVHPSEPSEHYPSSQEATFYHQQQSAEYQHEVQGHPPQQHHSQPLSVEPHALFQPEQHQYLVHSGYNVGSGHQEPAHHQHEEQPAAGKQRQTAVPCSNERLHVKIEYAGAAHGGIGHPIGQQSHHQSPLAQEPKKDYLASIPKSIAPKLNPLHHSFHQKRNFVPLHHITRQVPLPAGHHGHIHAHGQQHPGQQHQQQPIKAALAVPPPQHIAG